MKDLESGKALRVTVHDGSEGIKALRVPGVKIQKKKKFSGCL